MDSFDSDSYFQSSEKKKLLLCALNSQQNIVETIKNTPRNDQDLAKKANDFIFKPAVQPEIMILQTGKWRLCPPTVYYIYPAPISHTGTLNFQLEALFFTLSFAPTELLAWD